LCQASQGYLTPLILIMKRNNYESEGLKHVYNQGVYPPAQNNSDQLREVAHGSGRAPLAKIN
jgi:hypothetical protein